MAKQESIEVEGVVTEVLPGQPEAVLAHETLGAGEAHAALVGQQFTHGTDAAGAEVIDIVDDALALLEADEVFGGGSDIAGFQGALETSVVTENGSPACGAG